MLYVVSQHAEAGSADFQPSLLKSPHSCRTRFLKTCVRPTASFRWSRWPFQMTYANKLDGIQNHMVARLFPVQPRPWEDQDRYFERRRQLSAQISGQTGRWSADWAHAVLSWKDHVVRGHDSGSWSKPIFEYHGQDWLQQQRLINGRGRLGTRAGAGRPAVRYHEGICTASNVLSRASV